MGEEAFRVAFNSDALDDLDALSEYWNLRGEVWRAEKYHRDLTHRAEVERSEPQSARRGRSLKSKRHPHAREILAFGVYRIDEAAGVVNVLRFWHAHRTDPHGKL